MSFDGKSFRNALGSFVTGITVVTIADRAGAPIGVTMNSFNSLSLDPPMILFSLDKASDTRADFEAATYCVVNVLSESQQILSQRFASVGKHGLEDTPYSLCRNGCAVLEDTVAAFHCEITSRHDGGDHIVHFATVDHFVSKAGQKPLVYYKGKYRFI